MPLSLQAPLSEGSSLSEGPSLREPLLSGGLFQCLVHFSEINSHYIKLLSVTLCKNKSKIVRCFNRLKCFSMFEDCLDFEVFEFQTISNSPQNVPCPMNPASDSYSPPPRPSLWMVLFDMFDNFGIISKVSQHGCLTFDCFFAVVPHLF